MKNPWQHLPTTRRDFLRHGARGIGLLAFSNYAPAFLTHSAYAGAPLPEKDRTILVLVQLAGGNDGLNTLVPYQDDQYYRLRPNLGLKRESLHVLDDQLGLHESLGPFKALLDEGKLGIVQNVGYPNPNRSHFRSTEIWETASASNAYLDTGWVGRYFDNACSGEAHADAPDGIHLSNEMPQSFLSTDPHNLFGITRALGRRRNRRDDELVEKMIAQSGDPAGHGNLSFLQHAMMDTLATERRIQSLLGRTSGGGDYPQSPFAQSMRSVATLIAAGLPTRVYFVSLGGFDTHSNQTNIHANLLRQLGEGMSAFQRDLDQRGLAEQVLTMTFSEFGRRPAENISRGTDHGTAAPLFVVGSKIRAGLHGSSPRLNVARNQDLEFSTDFRGVYATVLDRWLGCDARAVLGGKFEPVAFV